MSDSKIQLPEVKNRNGFSLYFGCDNDYSGFKIKLSKKLFSLTLGFITLKIMFVSEAQYNRIITVATLMQSKNENGQNLDITINKH